MYSFLEKNQCNSILKRKQKRGKIGILQSSLFFVYNLKIHPKFHGVNSKFLWGLFSPHGVPPFLTAPTKVWLPWKTYSRLLSFFAFARVCRAPLFCLSSSFACYAQTVSPAARRFLMQNYQKDVTKQTVRRRKQEKKRNYIPKNVRRTNRNKRIM